MKQSVGLKNAFRFTSLRKTQWKNQQTICKIWLTTCKNTSEGSWVIYECKKTVNKNTLLQLTWNNWNKNQFKSFAKHKIENVSCYKKQI